MKGPVIVTVGHSDRTLAALLALLADGGVQGVADVRRRPFSGRHSHFDAPRLERALGEAGIAYRSFGSALGGWRGDQGEGHPGLGAQWRGYAAHMNTPVFRAGLTDVLEWAAEVGVVALLCAERDPARCHRSLIADALSCSGVTVRHGVAPGQWLVHRPHPALRCEGEALFYDRGMSLGLWG